VIAGGLDGQLKFFNVSDTHEVSVAYKIKLPSEIFALDFSGDGNHFAMGLSDGSLVIKSRMLEAKEEKMTDEQKMLQFEPVMISTSKNYKYFFRGQYLVTADPDDIQAPTLKKKRRMQAYEQKLKLFEYKLALNSALDTRNPEVVLSLVEELVERDALCIALGNRDEDELVKLFDFLIWKLPDHRYAQVLLEVTRIALNMYAGVVGLSDRFDNKLFNQLNLMVNDQIELQKGLLELSGQIELVTRLASLRR
jgi:U3 small nucleolar RNA-associated protein 15